MIRDNSMKEKWKVYRYTCSTSGKCYIGITKLSMKDRSRRNLYGYRKSPCFWNAIQKHGANNFVLDILHSNLTKDEAERLEVFEIQKHNSVSPHGYNLESGGNVPDIHPETRRKISESLRGKKLSSETRQKLSEVRRGRKFSKEHCENIAKANTGKKHSDATRRKISEIQRGQVISEATRQKLSEAHRGRSLSPEHRQKMSESQRGKVISTETRQKISEALRGEKNPNYGKKLSPEHRQKLSKAHRGKKLSPESIRKRSEARRGQKLSPESIRKRSETVRRKSKKAIWMYTRTLALYWFHIYDYQMRRRKILFDESIPDTSQATQTTFDF